MKTIASITIIGRRWFQRSAGNTYCSARAIVTFANGTTAEVVTPKTYGYGEHYLQVATDALEHAGYMPDRDGAPGWRYFRDDRKIPFHYSATDVARERDL